MILLRKMNSDVMDVPRAGILGKENRFIFYGSHYLPFTRDTAATPAPPPAPWRFTFVSLQRLGDAKFSGCLQGTLHVVSAWTKKEGV